MKMLMIMACCLLMSSALSAQNSQTLSGDWVRVTATQSDGQQLPYNHPARIIQRYYFTKDKVLVIMGNSTNVMDYSLNGNQFKLGPVQSFTIERESEKEMGMLETKNPIRYNFISTDSFTISGITKYSYDVLNEDTVYTSALGIEPIYPDGSMNLMKLIMQNFGSVKVSFEYSLVVLKDGTVGDVEVALSTNPKMNNRLIKIIKKTSGKWIPGALRGKPVNVKTKLNITLS